MTPVKNYSAIKSHLLLMYVIPVSVFVMFLMSNNIKDINEKKENKYSSSVWCSMSQNNVKRCKFKDVCYNPLLMTFLFYFGNKTVIRGLKDYTELQTIQLSSISFHNSFFANISVVHNDNYKVNLETSVKKGLLFARFKPDNIMHIIHDDLIPLFLTLEEICLGDWNLCEKDYNLVIHDNHPQTTYYRLYELFGQPIVLSHLQKNSALLCFDELHTGLITDSLFFQYGFQQVQGPIKETKLTHNDLRRFCAYFLGKLNIKTEHNNMIHIVLVSRKKSRRILNENNLIIMLKNVYSSKQTSVVSLDLSESNIELFLKEVAKATVFIGMHGAEMIFSIFLKSGSTLIELFPYGIQPNVVSFMKSISNLKGVNFNYISWSNKNKQNSVFHPDSDKLHGGITFLPQSIQDEIIRIEKVPAVHCCNNPMYLYYMYQDTWVEPDFEKFLQKSLKKNTENKPKFEDTWLFPSSVTKVNCVCDSFSGLIRISWKAPFNIRAEDLIFNVLFLDDSNFHKNVITNDTSFKIEVKNCSNKKFKVWISAINKVNNATSKDIYHECF